MANLFTRREVVKTIGAAALLGGIGGGGLGYSSLASAQPTSAARRRAIRVAHLTDVHVEPERKADQGMAACLHHVQSLADKPELILTGGDMVFDSFEADNTRTQQLWDLWKGIIKNECSIPLEHCIGNHDIWGGNKNRSHTTGSEPNYGKKRAMEVYNINERFRSFDRAGWHFIVLDSVFVEGDGYKARLDEPQYEWLEHDLASTDPKTPVLVLSHIPIVSITPILGSSDTTRKEWKVDGSLMHLDAIRLKSLFNKHKNVKLCLSGHVHLLDRVDYNGVSYICDGAVCGAWWKGRNKDCDEGYGVIDLYDDGSFDHQYIMYGWKAQT